MQPLTPLRVCTAQAPFRAGLDHCGGHTRAVWVVPRTIRTARGLHHDLQAAALRLQAQCRQPLCTFLHSKPKALHL